MQELRKIGEDETLANSLDPMNKNWKSLQSQNSGVTFPIKDIVVGQACFREDELALYMCANVEKNLWIKVADLTLTYVDKEYVDSMHIDLNRIDNIIDPNTGKIKMLVNISNATAYTKTGVRGASKRTENIKIAIYSFLKKFDNSYTLS